MQKSSDVFVPDHQQAQLYHNELLNRLRQERPALRPPAPIRNH